MLPAEARELARHDFHLLHAPQCLTAAHPKHNRSMTQLPRQHREPTPCALLVSSEKRLAETLRAQGELATFIEVLVAEDEAAAVIKRAAS